MNPRRPRFWLLLATLCSLLAPVSSRGADQPAVYSVGVAKVDITPDYPIRRAATPCVRNPMA